MKATVILTPEESNKNITLPQKDILTRLAIFLHRGRSIVVDRFGYLNKFSKYNVIGNEHFLTPLNNADFETFNVLCYNRAEYLIQKYIIDKNEIISIMWSGGVDSTSIISCFLRCNVPYNNFCVFYTQESIHENKDYFTFLIEQKVPLVELTHKNFKDKLNSGIIITGCCTDSLFEDFYYYKTPLYYNKNYKDYLYSNGFNEEISQIEEASKFYNIDLYYTHQFMYFEGFCCHFNVDSLVFRTVARNDERILQFFCTKEFQQWSLARFFDKKANVYKSDKDYKPELKLITAEVTKNNNYLNQTKVYSRRHGLSPLTGYTFFSYRDEKENLNFIPSSYSERQQIIFKETFFRRLLK